MPFTQTAAIEADLRNSKLAFQQQSLDIMFKLSDSKSLYFTNRVSKITDAVANWNRWEVTNKMKLVGVTFKIAGDMHLDFTDHFHIKYNQYTAALNKLKLAIHFNTFLTSKHVVMLHNSFCRSIIDYANVVVDSSEAQMHKFDRLM